MLWDIALIGVVCAAWAIIGVNLYRMKWEAERREESESTVAMTIAFWIALVLFIIGVVFGANNFDCVCW